MISDSISPFQPNMTGDGLNIAFSDEQTIKNSKIYSTYHCFMSKSTNILKIVIW